ncbi:MAG: glycosyltransferase [Eubacterium sp.]|nr:glycosyltransferase [Eubacterium sp.]
MKHKETRRDGKVSVSEKKIRILMLASVASMIDQFNMPNIRLLLKLGYEVHVMCNFKEGNTCDARQVQRLVSTLHDWHVRCHAWDCPRDTGIRSFKKCRKAYRQLDRLLERLDFAWIHCHSPIGGALARLAARHRNVRVIYTAHGFHFYQGAPIKNWILYYPAEKLLAHWTDILITINREDHALARRKLRAGKICYLPGVGIEISRFSAGQSTGNQPQTVCLSDEIRQGTDVSKKTGAGSVRREFCRKYRIPKQAVILLSVGELSRRKNHQAVLCALAGMRRQDVYYIICGQGNLRKKLCQQAKRLGVAPQVRMTGYQKDVEQMYRNADIFVFPSLQEGMPVALMEAMASGLVCAVSDIRGNRELVNEKGGFLFSPAHPQMLRDRLEKLLEQADQWQAYGRYNQARVKPYDQKEVMRRMKRIYDVLADV